MIAVLENDYKDLGLYSVALVKKTVEKDNPAAEEFVVIASLKETFAHRPEVLKEIGDKYEITAFLLREEGKDLQKNWASSINDN